MKSSAQTPDICDVYKLQCSTEQTLAIHKELIVYHRSNVPFIFRIFNATSDLTGARTQCALLRAALG